MKNVNKALLIAFFTISISWMAFQQEPDSLKGLKSKIIGTVNPELSHLKESGTKNLTNVAPSGLSLSSQIERLKHLIPLDLDFSYHKDVDEFWTGFFESFKSPKPTEFVKCFGKISGGIFFRELRTVNDLLQHSKEGNQIRLHIHMAQLELFMFALERTHNCLFKSSDFRTLADHLNMPSDPATMLRVMNLYYQARYHEIANSFSPIVEKLDKKEYQEAGKLCGNAFNDLAKAFKEEGEDLLQYQAFGNGVSIALDIPLINESLQCYDSKSARSVNDFIKAAGLAIREGGWYNAEESAHKFWENEGKVFMKNIPNKLLKCDVKATDSKKLSEKIGMELGTKEFTERMWNYVKHHHIMFYNYMRSMRKAVDEEDFLHAGAAYAHLVESAGKTH